MSAEFSYGALPVFDAFERVSDPALYAPLPDDWHVGVADVVKSTAALKAGRYKAVNMAGASVVAAVKNALGGAPFPFVFGGDGAVLAVPGEAAGDARAAMARCANYVADEWTLRFASAASRWQRYGPPAMTCGSPATPHRTRRSTPCFQAAGRAMRRPS